MDLLSLLGNLASLVSLGLAIWALRKSAGAEDAADEARRDAKRALDRVGVRLLLHDVGVARRLALELQGTCRGRTWTKALRQCDELRGRIGSLCNSRYLEASERRILGARRDDLGRVQAAVNRVRQTKVEAGAFDTSHHEAIARLVDLLGRVDRRMTDGLLELE